MTLIAITADAKHADILTDSTSYGPSLRTMGHATKVLPLTHLDAAVITQGDSEYGRIFDYGVTTIAGDVSTFDELIDLAPEIARAGWEKVHEDRDAATVKGCTVFLVGWSDRAQSFQAWGFDSDEDFEPWQIDGLHLQPTPLRYRPGRVELAQLAVHIHPDDIAVLRNRPQAPTPRTAREWIDLGKLARAERTMVPIETALRVHVGGALFHTVLKRGLCTTKRVHEFNDSGEEFQRAVAGSLHPQSQLGPCTCGSGKRYIDCHLVAHFDKPCLCHSGKPLRDCCLLPQTSGDPATA